MDFSDEHEVRRRVKARPAPADVRTQKTRRKAGGGKPDAADTPLPPRHDDARQALSELRRIVDAERHRIRGKLIPMTDEIPAGQNTWNQADRFHHMSRKNLMAEAMAPIISHRSALPR
jgi:hypothetical protein